MVGERKLKQLAQTSLLFGSVESRPIALVMVALPPV